MTGAEFGALSDDEADRQVDDIGVFARVAPEHKVRLVEVLKAEGQHRRDDRRRRQRRPGHRRRGHRHRHGHHRHRRRQGRGQDDPRRRQLRHHRGRGRGRAASSTTTCRSSSASRSPTCSCSSWRSWARRVFAIAGTALFSPLQVLWIHMAIVAPDRRRDGPRRRRRRASWSAGRGRSTQPIIVPPDDGAPVRRRPVHGGRGAHPRPRSARRPTARSQVGQTMAARRPLADEHLPRPEPALPRGQRVRAGRRWPTRSSCRRSRGSSSRIDPDHRDEASCRTVFGTISLTGEQWGICLVPGVILLVRGELLKVVLRARRSREETTALAAASASA